VFVFLNLVINCYEMVHDFTTVKQITSGPSPVDAAREKLDCWFVAFRCFGRHIWLAKIIIEVVTLTFSGLL
jgi:hypothetical protein